MCVFVFMCVCVYVFISVYVCVCGSLCVAELLYLSSCKASVSMARPPELDINFQAKYFKGIFIEKRLQTKFLFSFC